MRLVVLLFVVSSIPAAAEDWHDVPALVTAAAAKVEPELRTCSKLPKRITIIASRAKAGTSVSMPFPPVGGRGFTPEERCLMAAIPKIALPALPAGIDRVLLGHTVMADGAAPPSVEKAFDDWRDPAVTIANVIDDKHRAALVACDAKRTVRLILDLTAGKTRVWLPAWQFHSPRGDGSTPPAAQRVKACLTKAIAGWQLPVLPAAMAELEITIAP